MKNILHKFNCFKLPYVTHTCLFWCWDQVGTPGFGLHSQPSAFPFRETTGKRLPGLDLPRNRAIFISVGVLWLTFLEFQPSAAILPLPFQPSLKCPMLPQNQNHLSPGPRETGRRRSTPCFTGGGRGEETGEGRN